MKKKEISKKKDRRKKLSGAKSGGSPLDTEGKGVQTILERIKGLRNLDNSDQIVVFSAPKGFTDELITRGES